MNAPAAQPPTLIVSDLNLTALASATDGKLLGVREAQGGRLEFVFTGVPADLPERVLNDEVTVSAKRFIAALEAVHALIAQRKRSR